MRAYSILESSFTVFTPERSGMAPAAFCSERMKSAMRRACGHSVALRFTLALLSETACAFKIDGVEQAPGHIAALSRSAAAAIVPHKLNDLPTRLTLMPSFNRN